LTLGVLSLQVSWNDAYSGYGKHYFELNHVDKGYHAKEEDVR